MLTGILQCWFFCDWLTSLNIKSSKSIHIVIVVQLLSHIQLFVTPWTAVCQTSLSLTISQSLLKLMSIE